MLPDLAPAGGENQCCRCDLHPRDERAPVCSESGQAALQHGAGNADLFDSCRQNNCCYNMAAHNTCRAALAHICYAAWGRLCNTASAKPLQEGGTSRDKAWPTRLFSGSSTRS